MALENGQLVIPYDGVDEWGFPRTTFRDTEGNDITKEVKSFFVIFENGYAGPGRVSGEDYKKQYDRLLDAYDRLEALFLETTKNLSNAQLLELLNSLQTAVAESTFRPDSLDLDR